MRFLIAFLLYIAAVPALAVEKQVACEGNSCNVAIYPRTSGGVLTKTLDFSTSALVFGVPGTNPGVSQSITLNGALLAGGTGTSDADGRLFVNANAYISVASANNRKNTTLGGVIMQLIPRTSGANPAFVIATNQAADGLTTVPVDMFSVAQNGTVTIGSSGSTQVQTVNGKTLDVPAGSVMVGPGTSLRTGIYQAQTLNNTGTCAAACSGTANLTNYGFASGSGACLMGWTPSNVASSCADTTSGIKQCLCAGVK